MLLLKASPQGHIGFFEAIVRGDHFQSYVNILKNIPTREWDKSACVWRIAIHDYDILREECLKANLNSVDVDSRLKEIITSFKIWEQETKALIDSDNCELVVDESMPKIPLMNHQKVALKFFLKRGIGINCDEMGLGKTYPALLAALHLHKSGKINGCLVACIASVKWNWVREIVKCLAPDGASDGEYIYTFNPETELLTKRPREEGDDYPVLFRVVEGTPERRVEQYFSKAVFHIVNYEIIRNDIDPILYDTIYDCIIVDEIHRIRTYSAKQTKALYQLGKAATYRYGLTGTPIQNKLRDLYSIMRFIHPHLLGNWFVFDNRYCEHGYFGEITGHKRLNEIHKKLQTIMIRRLKKEVLKDLPDKVYNDIFIDLSKEQRKFYNQVRDKILTSDFEEVEEKINKQANILANITFLREVCDSCELIDPTAHDSSKLKELRRIVEDLLENEHKVVIFSQFERMTRIIERELRVPAIRLHGGISTQGGIRDGMIREFAESKTKNVFIMTTAGGEGINLQCADYIIFFDLPFNPQVIAQVEDRLHRKGQKSTVNVIKLIAKDTVEDRVLEILKAKTKLFREVIDGISEATGALTQKELLNAL